ncbi:MAG: hypothetical protein AAFP70_10620 [Calditrichota bacterium]
MATTPESAQIIQALMALPFLLMGISHIVQPKMWLDLFNYLHELGPAGVVMRTFALELVPAVAIVTFHLIWSGPEVILTLYGCLLMLKITVSLLAPSIGLKSLAMADKKGDPGFIFAGIVLVALGILSIWCLLR